MAVKVWPNPLLTEPSGQDDLLRLVQVRDLMAGQAWYDLVQHRLQPDAGLDMHWSRLIDAPMAALWMLGGENFMLFAWPFGLIGVILFAMVHVSLRLGGAHAGFPALVVAALCVVPLSYFVPGKIDHHNVQFILALLLCAATLYPLKRLRDAAVAAFACALMMAIGLETLPYIVLGTAIIAINWALGYASRSCVMVFGVMFPMLSILAWVIQTPFWAQGPVCDMLSAAYLAPITIGGIGLSIAAHVMQSTQTGQNIVLRFGVLGLIGGAAVISAWLVNPLCLAGPYAALSLELQQRWLSTVVEAQPLSNLIAMKPSLAFERFSAPIFALIIGLSLLPSRQGMQRNGLIIVLLYLMAALAISVLQLRATPFAHAFTIPIFALAISEARKLYNANPKALNAIALMAATWTTCNSLFWPIVSNLVFSPQHIASDGEIASAQEISLPATLLEAECADPTSRAAIAALGVAKIATPVFLGPQILEMGSASVIAGPYHRGSTAILDMVYLFENQPEEAPAILAKWRADYVVFCQTNDDAFSIVYDHPNSLTAQLIALQIPDFLEPIPTDSMLKIYRMR